MKFLGSLHFALDMDHHGAMLAFGFSLAGDGDVRVDIHDLDTGDLDVPSFGRRTDAAFARDLYPARKNQTILQE